MEIFLSQLLQRDSETIPGRDIDRVGRESFSCDDFPSQQSAPFQSQLHRLRQMNHFEEFRFNLFPGLDLFLRAEPDPG